MEMEMNELIEQIKKKFEEKDNVIKQQKDLINKQEIEIKNHENDKRILNSELAEANGKLAKFSQVLKSINS